MQVALATSSERSGISYSGHLLSTMTSTRSRSPSPSHALVYLNQPPLALLGSFYFLIQTASLAAICFQLRFIL